LRTITILTTRWPAAGTGPVTLLVALSVTGWPLTTRPKFRPPSTSLRTSLRATSATHADLGKPLLATYLLHFDRETQILFAAELIVVVHIKLVEQNTWVDEIRATCEAGGRTTRSTAPFRQATISAATFGRALAASTLWTTSFGATTFTAGIATLAAALLHGLSGIGPFFVAELAVAVGVEFFEQPLDPFRIGPAWAVPFGSPLSGLRHSRSRCVSNCNQRSSDRC
jgi:hypothetical protein